MTRLERLRASLEEPLLVTTPANVRYLVGFSSSNAALLVEPERRAALQRLPLRRDRPRGPGGRVRRGEAEPRTPTSPSGSTGPVGFEADAVTYAEYETLGARRARARPAPRPRRGAARGQGEGRAGRDPRGGGDHERGVRAARRGALRRPHRARARLAAGLALPRARRRGPGLRDDRRLGAERRSPHARPTDRVIAPRRDRRGRLRRARRRLLLRLHAHLRDRAASRTSCARRTRSASTASSPGSKPCGPGSPASTPTPPRAT